MKAKMISKILLTLTLATSQAFGAAITDDTLSIGKQGSTANKTLKFGAGTGNKPQIRYNQTGQAIEFSNDGVDFNDIGSGSGGGGGINLLANPDFEKTPIQTNWTASAGTINALTSGGNFSGFGKKSISWTPAASANTFTSDAVTIPAGLFGAKGETSVYYKTASANYKLQLWNGTTALKEVAMPATSTFKKVEVPNGFIFPASGTVALRLVSGDTTVIYFDKAYTGSFNSFVSSGAQTANFLANGDLETGNTSDWKCFASAATTRPVDGMSFAGSPTVTMSASDVNPIKGSYSAIFTKTAVNSQGQGCYIDFAVQDGDLAKVLQITSEYKVNSGTFVAGDKTTDSDVIFYLYDIDAGKVIEPTSFKLLSSSTNLTDIYNGTAQTTSTSKNYRLIAYVATTSANAFTLKLDNFVVARSEYVFGTPITDWTPYTATLTATSGSITNATTTARYRRVGDSVELDGIVLFSGASSAFTSLRISSPVAFDFDKMSVSDYATTVGFSNITDDGAANVNGTVRAARGFGNVLDVQVSITATHTGSAPTTLTNMTNSSAGFTFGANDSIKFRTLPIPVVGWSSSVQMASPVSASPGILDATQPSAQNLTGSFVNLANLSPFTDTLTCLNATTGVCTIPESDYYDISYAVYGSVTTSGTATVQAYVYNAASGGGVLGSGVEVLFTGAMSGNFNEGRTLSGLYLSAGTQISVRGVRNANTTAGTMSLTRFGVRRSVSVKNGAAVESVAVNATGTAGDTINNSANIVKFINIEDNTHGAYNASTGIFTVPVSGRYNVSWRVLTASSITMATTQRFFSTLYRNGEAYRNGTRPNGSGGANQYDSVGSVSGIYFKQGEQLSIYSFSDVAATAANDRNCHLSIVRVGL